MMHIFHNWTKWGDLLPSHALESVQYRRCAICNAITIRRIDGNITHNIPTKELNLIIMETK